MKKMCILSVLFMAIFTACQDDGEDEPEIVLEVSPTTLDFPAAGTTKKVTVTSSNLDWTFASEAEWCKVERLDNQLEITVDPYNALELRSTKVVVKAKDATDQIINIRQSAAAEATLVITPDTLKYFVAKEPEAQILTIETNQSKVTVSRQADTTTWCKVTVSDDYTTVTVAPETNKDTKERTTSFMVQAGEKPNMKEILFIVKQEPAKLVEVNKIDLNEIGYRVIVPVDAKEGTYTATAEDEWCTVKTTVRGLEISAPAFKEETDRNTTVSLLVNEQKMATIEVTQHGGILQLHDEFFHNGELVGVVGRIDDAREAFFGYATIYVVALEEKELQWSTEKTGVVGITPGMEAERVMSTIKSQTDWQNKFPGFAYCEEMSKKTGMDNWTLGMSQENIYYIYRDESGKDERGKNLNAKIESLNGTPFNGQWYWLNAEVDDFVPEANANTKVIQGYWLFNGGQLTNKWFYKDEKHFARCIWSCDYSVNKATESEKYQF